MAQRGGKRPGAGRKKGARNKATDEQLGSLTEMAQAHTAMALQALVSIATCGESEAARVSAANAILDRGYGKPSQALEHTGKDGGPVQIETNARDIIAGRLARLGSGDGASGDTREPDEQAGK